MKIVIGSDHAGFPLKPEIVAFLKENGHNVTDVGCHSLDAVDFPDISKSLCEKIVAGEAERGILVCGTGVGACIAANKMKGIRAALCHDYHSAHQSVEHDDVNVMCIGGKIVGAWLARDLVAAFVQARFDAADEDLVRRVRKLNEM